MYEKKLKCLVAIELKIGEFKPEYISKMDLPTLVAEYKLKLINNKLLKQKLRELSDALEVRSDVKIDSDIIG